MQNEANDVYFRKRAREKIEIESYSSIIRHYKSSKNSNDFNCSACQVLYVFAEILFFFLRLIIRNIAGYSHYCAIDCQRKLKNLSLIKGGSFCNLPQFLIHEEMNRKKSIIHRRRRACLSSIRLIALNKQPTKLLLSVCYVFISRSRSLFLEEEEEDLLFVSSDETSRLVPLVLREEKKTRARERDTWKSFVGFFFIDTTWISSMLFSFIVASPSG